MLPQIPPLTLCMIATQFWDCLLPVNSNSVNYYSFQQECFVEMTSCKYTNFIPLNQAILANVEQMQRTSVEIDTVVR